MPNKIVLLTLITFLSIGYGQEICNNGIDDDGDSLIDYLDTVDCNCNIPEVDFIPNFLPNTSFELYSELPNSFSDMHFCNDWFQATNATSDYHHSDGFNFGLPINPPPYGKGYVGFFVYEDWLEYVGACLNAPLVAGTSYTFKCKIAAYPLLYGELIHSATGNMSNTSIDITIYGHPSCYTFPIPTVQSPPEGDPGWVELGQVNYIPQPFWSDLEIVFTPAININSIIFGPPQYADLPLNFEGSFMASGSGPTSPYFFMDFEALSTTANFNHYNMQVSSVCNNLIATSTNGSSNFFWDNGVVNDTLMINNPGEYIVTAVDTNGCMDVDTIIVNDLFNPVLPSSCSTNPATIFLNSNHTITSFNWDFPTGSTGNTTIINPVVTFSQPDTNYFSVIVSNSLGCIDTINGAINILQLDDFTVPNVLMHSSNNGNNFFDFNSIVPGMNECMSHEFYIYNRWGAEVFHASNNKNNPDTICNSCFKGKSKTGAYLSAGTYFYVFDLEGKIFKGFIEVFD